MADLAEAKGLKHLVPFTYSFMPTARYLKEADRQGLPGYTLSSQPALLFRLRTRRRLSLAPRPQDRRLGRCRRFGLTFSIFAEWFYGEISAITCRLSHIVPRPPKDPQGNAYEVVDDSCMIISEFANGAKGMIHCTALCYEDTPFGQTHHMEFHGSDGTLYCTTDWDKTQQVKGARVGEGMVRDLPIPEHIWGDARRDIVHNTYKDMFRSEDFMIRGFINGIINDGDLVPNFQHGARIQRLVSAAVKSHETGQRVEVTSITA